MGLNQADSLSALCREMFEYHRWRQEKVSRLLEEIESSILSQKLSGSFSSLNLILKHLVMAEMVWLGRVDHDSVAAMGELDVKGMLAVWKTTTDKWAHHLARSVDDDFKAVVVYYNSQGEPFQNSLAEIVLHMIDHCSYHVGQIMNAIRGFGKEPVPTNFIHYLRSKKN
jgi:uncharacterized damage-inducible protein DinB